MVHVIADVGGTNVRLAAVEGSMDAAARALMNGTFERTASYRWDQIDGLDAALNDFRSCLRLPDRFAGLTLAIAGLAFEHQTVFSLTNRGGTFTREQLAAHAQTVRILNDFAAQAAIVPLLTDQDLEILKPGVRRTGPCAVLGPGTGLGVAGLDAQGRPWAGEGGNVTAPYLWQAPWQGLKAQISGGRLRAEDVFSGQGLENLYTAQTGQRLAAEQISAAAHQGDAASRQALSLFFDFGAALCSDQALHYAASGGVYLVGAIMMKNRDLLDRGRFAEQFCDIRTHSDFLGDIPVYQVTKPTSGLAGVAAYEAAC